MLAQFGELHPDAAKAMDAGAQLSAFEIFLDALPADKKKTTRAKPALGLNDLLPVTRDFAFIVATTVAAADIVKTAQASDKAVISDVSVFDVYQGKGVAEGQKSIAIQVTLQQKERTLVEAEIEALGKKLVADVLKATGGELRG